MGNNRSAQRQWTKHRKAKLARLRACGTLRVLDLFAGCGGMSLGFAREGFQIVGSVECDDLAALSHAINFHRNDEREMRERHRKARDITATAPKDLVADLQLGDTPACVDVIVGGPPCQSYARVGRAKLREVNEHPKAFKIDPRGNLYLRYLEYVREFQPLALMMENVPDVLNNGGHNVAEEMCEALAEMGYVCRYTLLNAAYYGVPQMRERAFLVCYAEELGADVTFPAPTHWVKLPPGYEGTRAVALKNIPRQGPGLFGDDEPTHCYVTPPAASDRLPPAVTAEQAIGDLPHITLHLEGQLRRGARRFETYTPYPVGVEPTPFARTMREWPGFESPQGINDHVIRSLPRDYMLFRRMNPGDQYPQAHRHALNMLDEEIRRLARRGTVIKPDSPEYDELRERIVPPYDPTKFPNKWRKMERDMPARTLMAHIGKDTYSHIHYDSEQARTISVREAARLQSFPDGFIFAGTMNPAFRQIGNAVPPLMAAALARVIREAVLEGRSCRERSLSSA